MEKVNIGIIGGSGLYQMPELENVREVPVDTPFGKPSDAFIIGELEGVTVAFLPRHGRGHKIAPTELPFRANIYAMKLLGIDSDYESRMALAQEMGRADYAGSAEDNVWLHRQVMAGLASHGGKVPAEFTD